MSKIVICAIAKNEDRYVEDWLLYHFCLGFTDISIYDNNIPERKGDLRRLIDNSTKLTEDMKRHTEIIDATDKRSYQIEAYQKYHKTHKFDWCAFIDIDEFITLNAWKTIGEMVNDKRFADATAIFLAWDTISDDNIVDVPDDYIYNGKACATITDPEEREAAASEWEKIPVYERLCESRNDYEPHASKMIIRGGLPNIDQNIHHYSCDNPRTKFPNGKDKMYFNYYVRFSFSEFYENKDFAYIRHYRTKTIREFLRQKYLNQSDAANYSTRSYFVADYFFKVNEETAAKMEYYNKHHKPITLCIVLDEDDYDDNINSTDLIYICNRTQKFKNPFIVPWSFVHSHWPYIDRVVVI